MNTLMTTIVLSPIDEATKTKSAKPCLSKRYPHQHHWAAVQRDPGSRGPKQDYKWYGLRWMTWFQGMFRECSKQEIMIHVPTMFHTIFSPFDAPKCTF